MKISRRPQRVSLTSRLRWASQSVAMLKDEARDAFVREWLARPASERTQPSAVIFAADAMQRYRFQCKGDPFQHIMGWIAGHITS